MIRKRLIHVLCLMTLIPVLVAGCGTAVAQEGDTVMVHYTGTLDDGTVFETSSGGEPLEFTLGAGQVIPGFENAVLGMKIGESKTVHIPVDQAYGPRSDDLIVEVERSQFPEDSELEIGQQWQLRQENGGTIVVTITEISETTVTIDANPALAGKDLNFEIELVEIK